jgi:ATP-dependent Clp protease protease subunit
MKPALRHCCAPRALMRPRLIKEISQETGQPYEKVVADTERNFWMGAEDAVKYGLAAKVISSADEV